MNLTDNNVKEAVVKAYMERCKVLSQARFLEWRLEFKMTSAKSEEVSSFHC